MKNIFELRVCGIGESRHWFQHYSKIIGLVNPEAKVAQDPKYHVEYFHDVMEPIDGWVHPTIEHMERVLEFSKTITKDDKLLVHCNAGVSRSTATAIMVCMDHGLTADEAFRKVYEVRPHMNPNSLLLTFADELLGCDGSLLAYYKQWLEDVRINPQNFAGQDKFVAKEEEQRKVDDMKDILSKL